MGLLEGSSHYLGWFYISQARQGKARQGKVRQGKARQGKARQLTKQDEAIDKARRLAIQGDWQGSKKALLPRRKWHADHLAL